VVTGANLGQPLGIVMLNLEAVAKAPSRPKAARRWSNRLRSTWPSVNATLDPHEQLQCIVVSTTPWTVENDIITPTFKVKRNRIEDLYAAKFNEWEESRKKVLWA
jgi:long-chain acyl-CoA synthetase